MATAVDSLGSIEADLAELWRSMSSEDEPVTRACKMNLVVLCDDGAQERNEATRLVAGLSETQPARAIVVTAAGDDRLHAYVSAHCHRGASGRQVCSEQITLEVPPTAPELAPTSVLQLLVEDMPIHVLWRRRTLAPAVLLEGLASFADRIIVDASRLATPLVALSDLVAASPARVQDLAWVRLDPWREAFARLFDPPERRACLGRAHALEVVAGSANVAGYLVGWLADRLGWSFSGGAWNRRDGAAVSVTTEVRTSCPEWRCVRLRLDAGSRTFLVERTEADPDVLQLSVEPEEASLPPSRQKLPRRDETAVLCGLFQSYEADTVYGGALSAALHVRR